MKSKLSTFLIAAIIGCLSITPAVIGAISLSGCTVAQVQAGLSDAQTAANILETINTDTGGGVTLFTQALVDKALTSTHNSGDIGIVNATIAEGAAALKVQTAASQAGVSSTAGQSLTTAVLTDPAVINTGAAAAAGATGSAVPTAMFKISTHPRPIYRWKRWDNVQLAKN